MKAEEYLYETHFQALWNTINFLGRGMAFYLAINAAIFGYVLTAKLELTIQTKVLTIGLVTSVLFAVCSVTCIWWCRHMGQTIKQVIQAQAPDHFGTFKVEANFKRGQLLFMTFGISMLILVLCITASYVWRLWK